MVLAFAEFTLLYFLLAGLGINLVYHRVLSHRSLRLARWLERTLALLGLPAGTPVQWAGNHRFHHAHADTPLDPHSPLQHGFWHAHVGWYLPVRGIGWCVAYSLGGPLRMLVDAWMRPRTTTHSELAADIAADPWHRWLDQPVPYAIALHLHAAIPVFLMYRAWGWAGVAWVWFTLVVIYNLADGIDSFTHLYGRSVPGLTDGARNNTIFGILALGEGWHANHHRYPQSARHGILPGQFDWTWQVIRLLRALGAASDVRVVNIQSE
ncbi:MAG TPA: acyl-CoA desaturase [Candidatus Solibacter sp.]|nr:acyl-CoA desaturase [Candidatus Solibacter sp.]